MYISGIKSSASTVQIDLSFSRFFHVPGGLIFQGYDEEVY